MGNNYISAADYEDISKKCMDWAEEYLGNDFKFREFQLDCIVKVVLNALAYTKTQVCEAPTGTGKTIIAFVSAGVLAKYFDKKTYILCSDTSLFKQYESDISRFNLPFGCISGKDNYLCQRNGLAFKNATCQNKNISLTSLLLKKKDTDEFKDCLETCRYVNAYRTAKTSYVTVMTYQLFFSIINNNWYDEKNKDGKNELDNQWTTWGSRFLVIGDEAHRLPDIVQNMFSPKITIKDNFALQSIISYGNEYFTKRVPQLKEFQKVFDLMSLTIRKKYDTEYKRNEDLMICLRKYKSYMTDLKEVCDDIQRSLKDSKQSKKDLIRYSKHANTLSQDYLVLSEYCKLIENKDIGVKYLVASQIDNTIVYNCAREADMVNAFFHDRTICEFLMSATIGNLDNYRTMIASDNETSFKAFEIDNGFDFSKSPIYYNDKLRLSYKEKQTNLPSVMRQIEEICSHHKGIHGIIQTGSYEFMNYLRDHASPELKSRLIYYTNSSEKKTAIYNFESFYGKILIGPSLLEGLSFDDDKCRFIIVMKVPYASLSDKLVKAKMNVYPNWYVNDTINKVIQGVGRGVRSKTDWCETYILDGCWNDIVTRSNKFIPDIFASRMKKIEL